MKIALVSTCAAAVPPAAYGGIERFVGVLAEALVARGHAVTVYATGDSHPAGALRHRFAQPRWPPDYAAEREHAAFAWRDITRRGFDVVHVNLPDALAAGDGSDVPVVVTLHHAREPALLPLYAAMPEALRVALSRRQAQAMPELRIDAIVPHGLAPRRFPRGTGHGGCAAFLGRIGPQKAPHLAIDAARSAGVPLVLAGPHWRGDPRYDAYFDREMRPRLARRDGGVRWIGEVAHAAKVRMLGAARALLMPMGWDEPFGLVMIEAMLCGTPVIAFARGSAPEIVEPGVTGVLVDGVAGMAAALRDIGRIDRARCRDAAQRRFAAALMAARYEALYRAAVQRHRAGGAVSADGATTIRRAASAAA